MTARARSEELGLIVCRVARNVRPAAGYALVSLEPPAALAVRPGQFAMIRVPGAEVTLHRPMSILRAGETLELLVREVGPGSRALAALPPGSRLELLAPLGRPFAPPSPEGREVLVGGGVGAAPLVFFAETAAARGARPRMIYAGRSRADLVLHDRAAAAARLLVVTEDGSAGERGLATDPLERLLGSEPESRVLACGPPAMMAAAARMCAEAHVPCHACLEAMMACGFGACLGCAVPAARGGYLYVCSDGPVLDAADVHWDALLASARPEG